LTSKEEAFKSVWISFSSLITSRTNLQQHFDHELFLDQITRKLVPKEVDEKSIIP
jgi:hypothetical protein